MASQRAAEGAVNLASAATTSLDAATIAARWVADYRAATPATDMLYAAGRDDPAWTALFEELAGRHLDGADDGHVVTCLFGMFGTAEPTS